MSNSEEFGWQGEREEGVSLDCGVVCTERYSVVRVTGMAFNATMYDAEVVEALRCAYSSE